MKVNIHPSWQEVLQYEFDQPYFAEIAQKVRHAYATTTCYPPASLLFNAFNLTPFDNVKVVILGQDPYHSQGQAMGLSFSVPAQCIIPPSLRSIYTELADDLSVAPPSTGDLTHWAHQGVLLLNASLSVEAHKPKSHQYIGWEQFTDKVIEKISLAREHVVFILWGSDAQRKARLIDTSKHLVLKSVHPSPLSAYRGFYGCKHFSQANFFLVKNGTTPIQWVPN